MSEFLDENWATLIVISIVHIYAIMLFSNLRREDENN